MKLRPKYIKQVDKDISETKELLVCKLENTQNQLQCEVYDSHILIKYKKELQRVWSPQINITLREEDNGTRIRGSIGPSGEIWLVFIFFYFFFALLFFGASSFALMQFNLGHSPTISIYVAIFGFVAVAAMYLISYFGQYKSKEQIKYLYEWMEQSLKKEC